jgi:hypothetical protein
VGIWDLAEAANKVPVSQVLSNNDGGVMARSNEAKAWVSGWVWGLICVTEVFQRTAREHGSSLGPQTATDTGTEVIKTQTPESGKARPSPPGSGSPAWLEDAR